jgi:hypothetical protein
MCGNQGRIMITYLWVPPATKENAGSIGSLLEDAQLCDRVETVSYADAFAGHSIAAGAVVFADIPRLSGPALVRSHRIWQAILEGGKRHRPFNHPVRALRRFALLRRLHAEGLNSFDIWRGDERRAPMRFPLIVRSINDRDGPYGGPIHHRRQLDAAIESWIDRGRDPEHLLIIEFCNTKDADGLYRRYTAYVVGEQIFHWRMYCSRNWIVREQGLDELKPDFDVDALMAEEHAFAAGTQHVEKLRRIAAIAQLGVGRIDYGFENGRLVVWEINWSPLAHELPPAMGDPQFAWFMEDRLPRLRAAVYALEDTIG